MVQSNPLFRKWTVKKFQATVMNDIWPEVVFFTLISLMVTLVSTYTSRKLVLSTTLLTVLGTVLGLVISFRTSSAYERYQDGRKLWTTIMVTSRNLAQQIWFHVAFERPEKAGMPKTTTLEVTIEKKSMVNLVQAFSVSVKHFLRGEPGIYYDDLYPLISFLPKYAAAGSPTEEISYHSTTTSPSPPRMLPLWGGSEIMSCHNDNNNTDTELRQVHQSDPSSGSSTPRNGTSLHKGTLSKNYPPNSRSKFKHDSEFDPEKALPHIESDRRLKPARNPPKASFFDYFPVFRFCKRIGRALLGRQRKKERRLRMSAVVMDVVESNIPMELSLFLSNYISFLLQYGYVQTIIASGMMANVTSLLDATAQLERTRNTPLPFAYQAHLRMSLWLYLFFLPFQLFSTFGWFTIPATAFTSFLLLGFLEIGQEIENPFGYDLNDLDMDGFCLSLQRDLHEITTHVTLKPKDFIFTTINQPFAPGDRRSAQDLVASGSTKYCAPDEQVAQEGYDSIRRTLVNGWYEVENATREFKWS